MALIKTLFRALQPKTLVIQLCLPPLLLVMPAAGLFAWFAIGNLADEQRDARANKATHVGEIFQALPLGFAGKPTADIERFLLLAADYPVKQITITDELGNNVVAAVKPESAKAYLNEDGQKFDPPRRYEAARINSASEVTYWLPIKSVSQENYWLAVSASLQDINRWEDEQRLTALGVLAVLFAVLIPLLFYRAHKTQKVLRTAAEFANSLSTNPNSELAAYCGNQDVDNLVDALNRISKNWHHRLQISEQNASYLRMHKVAIDLHSAVCITNGNGRIEYVNQHFCVASGYEEKELIGKNISLLNSGYHDVNYFKTLWRTLALGRVWQGELCNRNKRGDSYWVKCTIAPIKDQSGRHCQYIAVQTPTSHAHDMGYAAAMK